MYIREARFPDDLDTIADLLSTAQDRPVTAERLEMMINSELVVNRCQMAIGEDREVIGFNWLLRRAMDSVGELQLMLGFSAERESVGWMLLTDVTVFALAHEYNCFSVMLNGYGHIATYLQKQEFNIISHQIESKLALATFEDAPFVRYLTRAKLNGVRFFTFGQLGDTAENRQKLYALHRELAADVPNWDDEAFPEFGQYQAGRIDAEGFEPVGCLIALAKDEWIGLAMLEVWDGSPIALNTVTGVKRAWRGRGIAQALKLVAVRGARQFGVEMLVTMNDARNEAMLAINQKMGYRPERELVRLQKVLSSPASN